MTNKMGHLIVISGPSGVGKGTVRKCWFDHTSLKLHFSISMTTRLPRTGEENQVDYYFVTKEQFEEAIKNDNLLEYTRYVDNYYGTPKDKVNYYLNEGYDVVLEIDVQGALQVKEKVKDSKFIFIAPPSENSLKERLVERATESMDVINNRLDKALDELKLADKYDYVVVNDVVERAASEIEQIVLKIHKEDK